MLPDSPSWAYFRDSGGQAALTEGGRAAAYWALGVLEGQLGLSWPRRQYETQGWVPGELLGYAGWRHELPRLLRVAAYLHRFGTATGFADAIRPLKRTSDRAGWNHFLLQLEVARAGHHLGMSCKFEPRIPDTDRSADIALIDKGQAMYVETTTLATGKVQRGQLASERTLQERATGLALQYRVCIEVELTAEADADIAQTCISGLESVAATVARTEIQITMNKSWGRAVVQPATDETAPGLNSFSGAAHWRDAWHRVEDALRDKARQLIGAPGAWIRIDLHDGTFGFTNWAHQTMAERAQTMDYYVPRALDGFTSVDGVIVSSGAAVTLGPADDPNATDSASAGHTSMIRRPVAPGLVRETVIIPITPAGIQPADGWLRAYDAEANWLDQDLQEHGLSPMNELR